MTILWGGGFVSKGAGFSSDGRSVVYGQKLNYVLKKMQDRWDVEHEGCRTVVMQTGGMRTGGKQDRRDAGQEGCRKGGMQDRRDAGNERSRT